MEGSAERAGGLGYDVAIVGYGPVGQTTAILLGRLGYSVAVFERWPDLYPRPRAVHFDDEIARVFQRIGIAEELAAITEPATKYEWQNADGETLLLLDRTEPGPSGWPGATMFTQPRLEQLLDRTAKAVPAVAVHQGWEVEDVRDEGDRVLVTAAQGRVEGASWSATGERREVTARYAIGCDGANSLVRERMRTPLEDLGFAYDWLIADTIPRDPGLLAGVNLQVCDPARPTTLVSGGPGRRRWEWMLLPGESVEEVEDPAFVWQMLARSGVSEADVTLERHTVYTFRARWAESWREGRLLLAGDAAHLMPPFAGQGLCSGIRDALSLSWHLDLVLQGKARESTLDAYTSERRGQLQHAIAISVELGKVICITDEAAVAARDEVLLGVAADPTTPPLAPPPPNLGPGVHERDGDEAGGAAGSLFPQGRAGIGGRVCLLEDATAGGFALYVLGADPAALLDEEERRYLDGLGCALLRIDADVDLDGVYREWFAQHGCAAALVRPDFYVFGVAESTGGVGALARRLQAALTNLEGGAEMLAG
ncbi:MAG TPA: bifunctional 3-(3-hydroxy-phenyl)propionate/3-hydroxycinnamic acid hydroxylase [Solirubrobacteraceae bacterium]|jgi:2-polyprenyl-6-methoxyphenol hydroxylase-like FAD-dependent oxidoreductase|nr:bifunctional 3-(3-hydroxy-phenyl)propionate/3-hydroxycinnamic acid hydroxylase [Solirubrobacteraceae bacterium]